MRAAGENLCVETEADILALAETKAREALRALDPRSFRATASAAPGRRRPHHEMAAVGRRLVRLRPELAHATHEAGLDGEERHRARHQRAVGDRDVGDDLAVAGHDAVDRERPRSLRRVLGIHADEITRAAFDTL